MRRSGNFYLLVVAALAVVVIAALAARHARITPRAGQPLVFDAYVYDGGDVTTAAPINHIFTFRNVGPTGVKLKKLRTTCACTVAAPSGSEFRSGESGTVSIRMKIGSVGINEQRVIIPTTDASATPVILKVRATYRPRAIVSSVPATPLVTGASPTHVQIVVLADTGAPVAIASLVSRTGAVSAKVVSHSAPFARGINGYYESDFDVAIAAAVPRSPVDADKLEVSFGSNAIAPLSIRIDVRGPGIAIEPSRILFVALHGSKIASQAVRVSVPTPGPIAVKHIANPFPGWLRVSETTSHSAASAQPLTLKLEIFGDPPSEGVDGVLQIEIATANGDSTLPLAVSLRWMQAAR